MFLATVIEVSVLYLLTNSFLLSSSVSKPSEYPLKTFSGSCNPVVSGLFENIESTRVEQVLGGAIMEINFLFVV